MKSLKSLFLSIVLLFPLSLLAQFTTVTAQVKDPGNLVYQSCHYNIDFVNNTGIPQLPLLSGAPFQTTFGEASCDSTGHLSIRLADSGQITPPGTQWHFSICTADRSQCFGYTSPACPTVGCITGTTIDISTALQAVAAALNQAVPTNAAQTFTFVQALPGATTWTVNHNFGVPDVAVTVYDQNGNLVVPDSVQAINSNTTVITFLQAQAGRAYIINAAHYTPTAANPNFLVANPTGSQAVLGDFSFNFGGSLSAKRLFQSDIGIFTNTQMNQEFTGLLNSINLQTEFQREQASNYATSSFSAGLTVPLSSTVYQANAIAGFVNSQAPKPSLGGTNSVAGYFQAYANGNNANVWPLNLLCSDAVGVTNALCLNELDFNIHNAGTGVTGILLTGASTATPASNATGIAIDPLGTGHPWITGYLTSDGAVSANGLQLGALSTANGSNSQPIQVTSISGGGVHQAGTIQQLASGILQLASTSGGITFAPASGTDAVTYNTFIQSGNPNPATAGQLRFTHAEAIGFRNNTNTGNQLVGIDSTDRLTYAGFVFADGTHANTLTIGTGNVTTAGTTVTNGMSQAQTGITVTGALTTDSCTANLGAALPATWQTGIQFRCDVTASGTVTVNLMNPTAGSITPAATQVNVRVTR